MKLGPEIRANIRYSAVIGNDFAELPVPPAPELLTRIRTGELWGEVSLYPKDEQFPRASIDWHEGHGFVFHCFENAESWGYFLTTGDVMSPPRIDIALGGQAMEQWPRELFVGEILALEALDFFLHSGERKPSLRWVRTDQFPRIVVWEGREGRQAWERSKALKGEGDV